MNWTEMLFDAVEEGDLEMVRASLAQGADVHEYMDGSDVLSHAVQCSPGKDFTVVELLLQAGASPNARCREDHTFPGTTALFWAASRNNSRLVELLIKNGATVEAEQPGEDGETSLHSAADKGNLEIVRLLLDAGGKSVLNTFDYISLTPLMRAVEQGRIAVARLLIAAGSDVNAIDKPRIGDTALHEITRKASSKSSYEMIKLLVDAGADPTIRGWMWITALDEAQRRVEKKKRPSEEDRKILALLEQAAKKFPRRI